MRPEELFNLAIDGNQSAWQDLYEMFAASVLRFFAKNLANIQLAEDKTQEVFVKVYRNSKSFKGGSFKAWIFKIARNTLIDTYRASSVQKELLTDSFDEVAQTELVEENVIKSIERSEMAEIISSCMDKLLFDERVVISLVYLAGLSVPEMADAMDIPLGTAKTHVRKARMKLDLIITEHIRSEGFK